MSNSSSFSPSSSTASSEKSIFPIPTLIRRLFDSFPLVTYPPEKLPIRSPRPSLIPKMYVWMTPLEGRSAWASKASRTAGMSCDPECLKWQTYFRFHDVEFRSVRSSNHACDLGVPGKVGGRMVGVTYGGGGVVVGSGGAAGKEDGIAGPEFAAVGGCGGLPFLCVPVGEDRRTAVVTAGKMASWTRENSRRTPKEKRKGKDKSLQNDEDDEDDEGEVDPDRGDVQAFMSLLDNEIRDAWLYETYLKPYYTSPPPHLFTTSPTASMTLPNLLLAPIKSQITTHLILRYGSSSSSSSVNAAVVTAEAVTALEALSGTLGEDNYFLGGSEPGLLDAAVFAWMELIIGMEGGDMGLKGAVRRMGNLMMFWTRVRKECWGMEEI